ncbi:NAD(P)H-dependent glycerol-3-phosphate dehydrogenase [Vallitaleaceae bacterium 9-2]
MNVSIIGAGGWGCALAKVLDDNQHTVTVWSKFEEEVQAIQKNNENTAKLPGIVLPETLRYTSNLEEAIKGQEILVMAVPSSFVRVTAKAMCPFVTSDQIIVNVAKGIEDISFKTLEDVILDEIPHTEVAVLSGPSHAEEVARGIPTSVVVGSKSDAVVKKVQDTFMNENFRVYGSSDLLGIELGGALKNVIALAAGISDGLGYGDNTKAALMTRGISEISRLGEKMGADPMTFNGLSGIGDLIVTCTSMHSRNRRAGILIGQGKTLDEALEEVKMVVEGVYSAKAALGLAKKYDVDMPIIEKVNEVLFEQSNPKIAVSELMNREKKFENL